MYESELNLYVIHIISMMIWQKVFNIFVFSVSKNSNPFHPNLHQYSVLFIAN